MSVTFSKNRRQVVVGFSLLAAAMVACSTTNWVHPSKTTQQEYYADVAQCDATAGTVRRSDSGSSHGTHNTSFLDLISIYLRNRAFDNCMRGFGWVEDGEPMPGASLASRPADRSSAPGYYNRGGGSGDQVKAAEKGNADAQIRLALMYLKGDGVAEDKTEAAWLFRQAAEQGHAVAQLALGVMYGSGEGVPEDDAEAAKWYRLAADQGLAEAQNDLGSMYDSGEGVPEDDAEAVKWYRMAADQGLAMAQYNLGVMYDSGEGVAEDDLLAHMWLNLARAQGYEAANEELEILIPRMTRDQIAEAQKMAREWQEAHPSQGE